MKVQVRNIGCKAVTGNITISFYKGDPQSEEVYLGSVTTAGGLQPSEIKEVTLTKTLAQNEIIGPVWVVVDDLGTVPGQITGQYQELDEFNNIKQTRHYLTNPANEVPQANVTLPVETTVTIILPYDRVTKRNNPVHLELSGTASDDSLPLHELAVGWSITGVDNGATIDTATSSITNVVATNIYDDLNGLTFTKPGSYQLTLHVDDGELVGSKQITFEVTNEQPYIPPSFEVINSEDIPGCITNPVYSNATPQSNVVQGIVPIKVNIGQPLEGYGVYYWLANDPSTFILLEEGTALTPEQAGGSQAIATLDTTLLSNDSYVIHVAAKASDGTDINCAVLITVTGENKPGRVTLSTTDLTIPVAGIPITIGRSYDSLERHIQGDFGYGWSLSLGTPRLEVDPRHNVTLTLPDGKRSTFFFAPTALGWGTQFISAVYVGEVGTYGELRGDCQQIVNSSGYLACSASPQTPYSPKTYTYTDLYKNVFVITKAATGEFELVSIKDKNGNQLTFNQNGINSNSGRAVTFIRDSQNGDRIAEIIDMEGNSYKYKYDEAGNLEKVKLPSISGTNKPVIKYDYYTATDGNGFAHLLKGATDPLGRQIALTQYYNDPLLDGEAYGRLKTVTDAKGNQTTYQYSRDEAQGTYKTTTVEQPSNPLEPARTQIQVFNRGGHLLTDSLVVGTETLTTSYQYDTAWNVARITNPAGETTCYTYSNGNQTSVSKSTNNSTNPCGAVIMKTGYTSFSAPAWLEAAGSTYVVNYNASGLPTEIKLNNGATLGRFGQWNSKGQVLEQYDANGTKTGFVYNPQGDVLSETTYLDPNDPSKKLTTTYTYDSMGRTKSVKGPNNGTTAILYEYDALGNIKKMTDPTGAVTEYVYDLNGNRTEVKVYIRATPLQAAQTLITKYQYDELNRVTRVTGPDGGVTKTEYDSRGNVVNQSVLVNAGTNEWLVTTNDYDAAGRLTRTTNNAGTAWAAITEYVYDAAGRQIKVIDKANGTLTRYVYDSSGSGELRQVISYLQYEGGTNPVGKFTAQTRITQYDYDTAGRRTKMIVGGTTELSGTLATSSNATLFTVHGDGQQITEYWYDARGRLQTSTINRNQLDSSTTSYTYDGAGRQMTVKDNANRYACTQYNAVGQVTHQIRNCNIADYSGSSIVQYHYSDTTGLLEWVRDPMNNNTVYTYDTAGRTTKVTSGQGVGETVETHFAYDDTGKQISTTQKWIGDSSKDQMTSVQTSYLPDDLVIGRIETTTNDDASTTVQRFDKAGRLIESVDEENNKTTYAYHGGTSLLQSVTRKAVCYQWSTTDGSCTARDETVTYSYNAAGQVTQILNEKNNATGFEYALGFQTAKIWPDGKKETFEYDAFGRLMFHYLADNSYASGAPTGGSRRYYKYNRLNQLVSEQLDAPNTNTQLIETAYDSAGNRKIVEISELPSGATLLTTTYSYDALNNVTQVKHEYPGGRPTDIVDYTYDAANNRLSMTSTIGTGTPDVTTYTYDGLNRLKTVTADPGNPSSVTTYAYDPIGMLDQVILPNNIVLDYAYNNRNFLTELKEYAGSPNAPLAHYAYSVDKVGNRQSVVEQIMVNGILNTQTVTWQYDDAYRLISEKRYNGATATGSPAYNMVYSYDPAGNRATEQLNNDPLTIKDYTYNSNDQLTLIEQDGHADINYQYDDRGNLTLISQPGTGNTSYSYDALDRLTSATVGGTTSSYAYDHDGHRITQTVSGVPTYYVWDELSTYGDVIWESSGINTTSYVLGGSQLISQTKNGTTEYFLPDAQGSTRLLTNAVGGITANYTYAAFGDIQAQTGTSDSKYLYTGQQFDDATDLYSLRARYYDPNAGRFLSRDTWAYDFRNPIELNRYSYTSNNPSNFIDPSGHQALGESSWIHRAVGKIGQGAKYLYRHYMKSKFTQGFAGGIAGWAFGKLLRMATNLDQDYCPSNQCEWWWEPAAVTADMIWAGITGGFVENINVELSLRGWTTFGDKFVGGWVAAAMTGLVADLKNFISTPIARDQGDEASMYMLVDMALSLTLEGLAGGVLNTVGNQRTTDLLVFLYQRTRILRVPGARAFAFTMVTGFVNALGSFPVNLVKERTGPK